ncbi:metallophosphoesterase [Chungangia koreensis]|uniref:Metallophosphoesterase n=1 Tax=Chungangia koreensis TaxID=752657 RepID=A0ABV8X6A4_9LACT
MNKIKYISIPRNSRIIVISDIHGELELFKRLLDKVNYNDKEDYLIINGDLCEKGRNSKGVVEYILKLTSNNSKVHVTEGNCDTLVEDLIEENPKLINYLVARKNSLLNEWLIELDFNITDKTTVQSIKEVLIHNYSKEIKWLSELPTAIETEDYIFVHAGLDSIENWKETDRLKAISLSAFLEKTHSANKYVIVGHWPVVNYSEEIFSHNPIINPTKRIIAIDGGNVIKQTGQLNAFIINRGSVEDTFNHLYIDQFPEVKVTKDFEADSKMIGSVSYPKFEIQPVEKGTDFTLSKQLNTNQLLYVKNEYIQRNDSGAYFVKTDLSCSQINLNTGEIVSVIDDACSGYSLVKKDGVVGWVPKESLADF